MLLAAFLWIIRPLLLRPRPIDREADASRLARVHTDSPTPSCSADREDVAQLIHGRQIFLTSSSRQKLHLASNWAARAVADRKAIVGLSLMVFVPNMLVVLAMFLSERVFRARLATDAAACAFVPAMRGRDRGFGRSNPATSPRVAGKPLEIYARRQRACQLVR